MSCGILHVLVNCTDMCNGFLLPTTGVNPANAFSVLRKHQSNGPLVNSEFYPGWLDHWGSGHQTRSSAQIALYLDKILALNASVNIYMFEGGTNFGFMNGELLSLIVMCLYSRTFLQWLFLELILQNKTGHLMVFTQCSINSDSPDVDVNRSPFVRQRTERIGLLLGREHQRTVSGV